MTTFERDQLLFIMKHQMECTMITPEPPHEEPGEHEEPEEEDEHEPEEEEPGTAAAWRV
jgi:hypothetical protein